MTGARRKVAVLYNAPVLPADHPDALSESDVVEVASAVSAALADHGFEPARIAAGPPLSLVLRDLDRLKPDVVFNLIEGFGGRSALATNMTGVLELAGLPYTGSSVESLAICQSKSRTKALLRGFGLPTAPFVGVPLGHSVTNWPWTGPVIIKPDVEDGSLGINQESVVTDLDSARRRIAWIHTTYGGPALLEAYLPGPEFNIGVIGLPGPEPLPVAEVVFAEGGGTWPILTYDAKWSTGSAEDLASPIRCPARIAPGLAERLGAIAVAAFAATDCRDYARIDLRLDGRGDPMILEVNPNPDIGPTAGWARALRSSGRDYAATLAALVRQAMDRGCRGVAV